MTSRIDKFVREVSGMERLADASSIRQQPVTLLVDSGTPIVLLRTAIALAVRCFGERVHIRVRGPGLSSLIDAALEEAREYGAEDRVSCSTERCGTLTLGLGCCDDSELFVDARGWRAGVNAMVSGGPPSSPAASFAVSAGVAKLFGKAMGRGDDAIRERWSFSLSSLDGTTEDSIPDELQIGRLLLIGAGAIGAGFAHVLRHTNWQGHVEIVDRERYDEPNHETTLLISMQEARACEEKAQTLASLLRRSNLTTHGTKAEVSSESQILAMRWSAVVIAVDNPELRRVLDGVASPILNAGVGGMRDDAGHVLFSRHLSTDPVLSRLYRGDSGVVNHADAPTDIEDECSRLAYAKEALAAPFLGLAAGALLAAGVAHLACSIDAGTNYVKFDLLSQQRYFVREYRRR